MKDLYRCLDEYPEEFQRALAEAWHIPLPEDDPLQRVKQLGEGMLAAEALMAMLEALSPGAQQALAYLQSVGGAAPARTLAMRFGEVRRFGPAGLRREQPWLAPTSPLEELYYRGLVYRAFGTVDEAVGELYMVPTQLYARLPALEALSFRASIAEAKPQGDVVSQSDTLVEDVMAEVVQLRRQPLRLPADIEFHPQIANRLALGARMRGPASPKRLHLLWRVLCNQELVQHGGKQWHVTLQTRRWLGQSDGEQWLACFLAWRNDRSWDELYDLEAIACDRRACPNEPWAARQRLCGMLLDLIGPWYDLDSFIAAVRQHHPDYLRPDGDMDSWVIRDAASGEFIRGMGDWDRVEGALLKELISGPLHWLGIIDLAQDRDGRPILRVSEHGAELLAEMPPHTDTPPAAEPIATLDSHLFLSARTGQSRYQRYQVERLAVWQEQDAQQAHYRLTEDSIWQALNAGITHEQILSFLQRITGHGVPEIATRLLDAWGRRFGAVSLRRVVLLEARDAATMRQIRQQLGSTHLLGTVLDATRCLVDEDNMEPLVAALKRRGMWPRITRPEQKTGGS